MFVPIAVSSNTEIQTISHTSLTLLLTIILAHFQYYPFLGVPTMMFRVQSTFVEFVILCPPPPFSYPPLVSSLNWILPCFPSHHQYHINFNLWIKLHHHRGRQHTNIIGRSRGTFESLPLGCLTEKFLNTPLSNTPTGVPLTTRRWRASVSGLLYFLNTHNLWVFIFSNVPINYGFSLLWSTQSLEDVYGLVNVVNSRSFQR